MKFDLIRIDFLMGSGSFFLGKDRKNGPDPIKIGPQLSFVVNDFP